MGIPLTCCTAAELDPREQEQVSRLAAGHRADDAAFAQWTAGYGVITHDALTQIRVRMVAELVDADALPDTATGYRRLVAADRIASAGMWLVAHMTYAQRVRLDGGPLDAADFKRNPEGHTGGSLNMVPAYVAYLALNALDGHTRSWLMGQGHCVAAIDALNVIVGNMTETHAARYGLDDEGLSRLASDFYSFAIRPDGQPESPLGSHVNAHTAGGMLEGGYLGFAELQYVHAPLPGERLVAFLSDGAFEEQRGSDLGTTLVATAGFRTGVAGHDPQRTAHRAAYADRSARLEAERTVRSASLHQILKSSKAIMSSATPSFFSSCRVDASIAGGPHR